LIDKDFRTIVAVVNDAVVNDAVVNDADVNDADVNGLWMLMGSG